MKFLFLAVLACVLCKMALGRWPWDFLKGADRSSDQARARQLLGVGPRATREEITDAHRRLLATVHPDRGGSSEQVHAANAARDLLLGPKPGNLDHEKR